jgi:hypothetical protein
MSSHSPTRPVLQFSLQGLLFITALIAVGLAIYFGRLSVQVLAHYCFLVFAVGPWFAHLAAECLPIAAQQLRTAVANMILLGLFVVTLKLAEATLPGPIVLVVAVAAVVLWTPQYMMFFVWRMAE